MNELALEAIRGLLFMNGIPDRNVDMLCDEIAAIIESHPLTDAGLGSVPSVDGGTNQEPAT